MRLRRGLSLLLLALLLARPEAARGEGPKCEKLHKPQARNPLHTLGFSQTVGHTIVAKYPHLTAAIIKAAQTWHNRPTLYEDPYKPGTRLPEHMQQALDSDVAHWENMIDTDSPFAVTLYRGLNTQPATFDPNYNFHNADVDCVTPNLWIARNYAEVGAKHPPNESFWDDGQRRNPYPLLVRYELPALLLRYTENEYVIDETRLRSLGITDLSHFITAVAFPSPGRKLNWIRNWRSRAGGKHAEHAIKPGR